MFILFFVIILKYCNYLEETICTQFSTVKLGIRIIYWITFDVSLLLIISNQIPWDLKKNQNRQVGNLFCVHIVFFYSIEM